MPLRRELLAPWLTLSLACTKPGAAGAPDAPARAWHYQVRVDPALHQLEATVCFAGVVPRELRAGKDSAAGQLLWARWLRPGARRRLAVEHGRIQLLGHERDGCLVYAVRLAESGALDAAVRRVGRDLLASPNVWLWRPERRTADAHATLELQLPEGMAAALPWRRLGNGWRALDAEAFRFDGYAAFGRFTPIVEQHGSVELEAAILDGALAIDDEAVMRWLRSALHTASLSDGAFPRDRMAAIVMPSAAQAEPVPFGMVARGGSASLLLVVSESAREEALLHDWVAPHELSHLLLPFVEREHAWLSEGFATYYQELLLARAGLVSEREALRRLTESLRGVAAEAGELDLVRECARLEQTRNYRKVYWGGAAYWLSLDVSLRQQGKDLDQLLIELRREPDARGLWSGRELVGRLDTLAGVTLFTEGFDAVGERPFPEFEQALRALGVREDDAPLDEAAAGALRRQLFSR